MFQRDILFPHAEFDDFQFMNDGRIPQSVFTITAQKNISLHRNIQRN